MIAINKIIAAALLRPLTFLIDWITLGIWLAVGMAE